MSSGMVDDIDVALRDRLIRDAAFQDALQRYAHGNGSSTAVADALLTAARFWPQRTVLRGAAHALRSYESGNGSPDLAKSLADLCELELRSRGDPAPSAPAQRQDESAARPEPSADQQREDTS